MVNLRPVINRVIDWKVDRSVDWLDDYVNKRLIYLFIHSADHCIDDGIDWLIYWTIADLSLFQRFLLLLQLVLVMLAKTTTTIVSNLDYYCKLFSPWIVLTEPVDNDYLEHDSSLALLHTCDMYLAFPTEVWTNLRSSRLPTIKGEIKTLKRLGMNDLEQDKSSKATSMLLYCLVLWKKHLLLP